MVPAEIWASPAEMMAGRNTRTHSVNSGCTAIRGRSAMLAIERVKAWR
jgi:hypothetical protein